jgi:hypothetical protein
LLKILFMNKLSEIKGNGKECRDRSLGRVLSKALVTRTQKGQCPSLEDIAALVEGAVDSTRRDELMAHLAGCENCYRVFISTRELVSASKKSKKKAYVISGVAAAAVLLLALSISLQQSANKKRLLANKVQPVASESVKPAPGTVQKVQSDRGGDPGNSGNFSPMPAARMAGLVAGAVGAERFRALTESNEMKAYGFAGTADKNALAFRLGVSSTDLEIALLLDDRENALRQVNRMLALVEVLYRNGKTQAAMERLREQLEASAPLENFKGVTGSLQSGLAEEPRRFLAFGQWCEAARVAAASGNRAFFSDASFEYFRGKLPRDKAYTKSFSAVDQSLAKLRQKGVSSQEFDLLEKSLAEVIQQY